MPLLSPLKSQLPLSFPTHLHSSHFLYKYTRTTNPSRRIKAMEKIRSSICFSCCFRADADVDPHEPRKSSTATSSSSSLMQTSTTWIRSKAQEIPDMRGKCGRFVSVIGKNGKSRRHNSMDFSYDPFSYALNFDEGLDFNDESGFPPSEYRYKSFSSRLPASPPQPPPAQATAATAPVPAQ